MTNDINRLIVQFTDEAITAKAETAAEIRAVLDSMGAGAGEKIADHIAYFCERRGIDPKAPELTQYYRETTEYKRQEAENEARTKADTAAASLVNVLTSYKGNRGRGVSPAEKEMRELSKEIRKQAANLEAAPDKSDRIGSWTDYIQECINYNPDRDFSPALFGGIAFPDGTVSYLGARTMRGKTTALINLAREAITAKTPRPTLFITLEESRKQLLHKLTLSTAYAMALLEPTDTDATLLKSRKRPQTDLYHLIQGKEVGDSGAKEFVHYCTEAQKILGAAYLNKTLLVYDGRGTSNLDEITSAIIAHAGPGVLVLLDYIQRMPSAEETQTNDFYRMKKISDGVVRAAVESGAVIISGAQFKRDTRKESIGKDDIFDDASFRESADIEQDGHNLIGLGRESDKKTRFIEILKTREDAGAGEQYRLDFVGAYRYMACKKEPRHSGKKEKADEGTEKKRELKILGRD
jgi:hypothetical protein